MASTLNAPSRFQYTSSRCRISANSSSTSAAPKPNSNAPKLRPRAVVGRGHQDDAESSNEMTPGTAWWICTEPALTSWKGQPERIARVIMRVMRNVKTKAAAPTPTAPRPADDLMPVPLEHLPPHKPVRPARPWNQLCSPPVAGASTFVVCRHSADLFDDRQARPPGPAGPPRDETMDATTPPPPPSPPATHEVRKLPPPLPTMTPSATMPSSWRDSGLWRRRNARQPWRLWRCGAGAAKPAGLPTPPRCSHIHDRYGHRIDEVNSTRPGTIDEHRRRTRPARRAVGVVEPAVTRRQDSWRGTRLKPATAAPSR